MRYKLKKTPKEEVSLKHVETRGQIINKEELQPLKELQQQILQEHTNEKQLDPIDRAILASFEKNRMILERIWIILNQSRKVLGEKPLKLDEIKEHLDKLVNLEYLTHQEVNFENKINHVYILTEKGKEEII